MEPTTTSPRLWKDALARTLRRLRTPDRPVRVAIVGIGHELRGDDAAGIRLARALQPRAEHSDAILVMVAGLAPENTTGPIRRFAPDLVLLVDAAQMDAVPGTVRWLDWQDTTGFSASTHTLPPRLLAAYLIAELGCEVRLLGIQPGGNAIGDDVTSPVETSIRDIVQHLTSVFHLVPGS
jgi:hydrogenase maturation protease HycI